MKFGKAELLAIAGMVGAAALVLKAADMFAPSDIDLMSGTRGVIVYQEPLQKTLASPPFSFEASGAHLVPAALFDATGVVLGKRRYYNPWSDYHFAPWDIGLGWGAMSDPSALEHVSFWQSGRFLYYRYGAGSPVRDDLIVPNSGNIHVIPANEEVRDRISDIREGDIVRVTGFLVDVVDGDQTFRTSLTRTDTGAGACEILYVQSVDLDPL